MRKKEMVLRRWEILVRLVQNPQEKLAWVTMVLTLKGKGDFGVLGFSRWRGRYAQQYAVCCLARLPAQVQSGTGNKDGYPGGQYGSTYSRACKQASLPSVLDIYKA